LNVRLEVMNGAQDGDEFRIKKSAVIGREKNNEISLQNDRYISRRHAILNISGEEIILEDIGSTNGTFYDGERLFRPVSLSNGDFFRVGRTWIQISW